MVRSVDPEAHLGFDDDDPLVLLLPAPPPPPPSSKHTTECTHDLCPLRMPSLVPVGSHTRKVMSIEPLTSLAVAIALTLKADREVAGAAAPATAVVFAGACLENWLVFKSTADRAATFEQTAASDDATDDDDDDDDKPGAFEVEGNADNPGSLSCISLEWPTCPLLPLLSFPPDPAAVFSTANVATQFTHPEWPSKTARHPLGS